MSKDDDVDDAVTWGDDLEDAAEVRNQTIRAARTFGLRAAYESALEILVDGKAAAQAKTNAQRAIIEIGKLPRKDSDDPALKDPSTMTRAEIEEGLQASRMRLEALERGAKTRKLVPPSKAKPAPVPVPELKLKPEPEPEPDLFS